MVSWTSFLRRAGLAVALLPAACLAAPSDSPCSAELAPAIEHACSVDQTLDDHAQQHDDESRWLVASSLVEFDSLSDRVAHEEAFAEAAPADLRAAAPQSRSQGSSLMASLRELPMPATATLFVMMLLVGGTWMLRRAR